MGAFYDVLTHHGTRLAVDPAGGLAVHCGEGSSSGIGAIPLLAFVPENELNICFLLPTVALESELRIDSDRFPLQAIPLRAIAIDPTGWRSLFDIWWGTYLTAERIGEENGWGQISNATAEIGPCERFFLKKSESASLPGDLLSTGDQFDRILANGVGPDGFMRSIASNRIDLSWRRVINLATQLMPIEQLEYIADLLPAAPEFVRCLGQIYRGDPDANIALPRLLDWLRIRRLAMRDPAAAPAGLERSKIWHRLFGTPSRNAEELSLINQNQSRLEHAATETVGPEWDLLGTRGYYSAPYYSFPHACTMVVRQSTPPARGICAIASARNEGPYLLEWIAYHRAIGVESIFLYTNNNSDGSDELLSALAKSRVIVWMQNELAPGCAAQAKAYGHALGVLPDTLDYRWALVIDLDEFFVFNPDLFRSLPEYISWQEQQPVDAIALNWAVVGSGGQINWRDEPVTKRFTTQLGTAPLVKTMFRPRKFMHSTPHHPTAYRRTNTIFLNSDREAHVYTDSGDPAVSDSPRANCAWVNHYFFKSVEEFLWKFSRNRGDQPMVPELTSAALPRDFVESFVAQHLNTNGTTSDAVQRCVPDLNLRMLELMTLPGVASAQAAIRDGFRAKLDSLVELFASAPGIAEAGEAGNRFLEILRSHTVQPASERT